MTGERMRQQLIKRGYNMSPPMLRKITGMLDDLGLVEKVERPGMAASNVVKPSTVDKVELYLIARREHPELSNAAHSSALWRMLDNLGDMRVAEAEPEPA